MQRKSETATLWTDEAVIAMRALRRRPLAIHFCTDSRGFVDTQSGMQIAQYLKFGVHPTPALLTAMVFMYGCGGCQSPTEFQREIPVAMGVLPSPHLQAPTYRLGAGDGLGKSVFDWFASQDRITVPR